MGTNSKLFAVRLDGIKEIGEFVSRISTLDGDYDLSCGRRNIDAKSLMGIFSLDINQELLLTAHMPEEIEVMKSKLEHFIVREVF